MAVGVAVDVAVGAAVGVAVDTAVGVAVGAAVGAAVGKYELSGQKELLASNASIAYNAGSTIEGGESRIL